MPGTRRYVVHGRMPLKRTPQSGLFTTRFKEDAFFIDYNDRALLFNSGARTEQSLQLPLYFVEEAYHMRKRLVESIGFKGGKGRLELFVQYALLPLLDDADLENFQADVLKRAEVARQKYLARQEQQSLLDVLMLDWCDDPVILFEYDRPNFTLRVKARIPEPAKVSPTTTRTKRGRLTYYQTYEDLLCSKAAYYVVSAFQSLPFLQQAEVTLLQMESEPSNGLVLVADKEDERREFGLRRLEPGQIPHEETSQERKAREKLEREQAKLETRQQKILTKQKERLAVTQRENDRADELFDGTLEHQTPLLSARIRRQGFMDLQKSKMNYSARRAMEMFELRFDTDEEATAIKPVESFF